MAHLPSPGCRFSVNSQEPPPVVPGTAGSLRFMDNMYTGHNPENSTLPLHVDPAGDATPPPQARRGRMIRWAAGLGAAAVLIGGGAALAGGLGGQAPAADLQLAATTHTTATMAARHRGDAIGEVRHCLMVARELRRSGHDLRARWVFRGCMLMILRDFRGEHGTATFPTKAGSVTVAWERGDVTTAPGSGTTFAVRAADGTTQAWNLVTKSTVLQAGMGKSVITAGDRLFVIGPVVGRADDARLVLIAR